KNKIHFF
ncbi:putative lipoprotein, partial [Vibrio parahaemolyticus VPCR-2009]